MKFQEKKPEKVEIPVEAKFLAKAGLAFLLLATAEPVDLDTNELLIPAFMSVHLVMIILGIYTIRRQG